MMIVLGVYVGLATATPTADYDKLEAEARTKVFKVIIRQKDSYGGGTGFFLDAGTKGKFILTNRHICVNVPELDHPVFLLQDEKEFQTKIKRISPNYDLCLLQVTDDILKNSKAYVMGPDPVSGQHVLVYGHPFLGPLVMGHGPYLRTENLPAQDPDDPFNGVLAGRFKFPVWPGNSGSPVINNDGQVVGIVFAYEGSQGLFIPLVNIKEFLEGK